MDSQYRTSNLIVKCFDPKSFFSYRTEHINPLLLLTTDITVAYLPQ